MPFSINGKLRCEEYKCKTLTGCIAKLSTLSGKKYIYDVSLKGSIKLSKNYKIHKGYADGILSMALNANGYTRIPTQEKDTYRIINARDVRYLPTLIILDKKNIPNS